ncbi:MAG: 50S ribosomal protein L9 [Eubacteriales bacterium]|nr:50S ribosomal protein L9 [Eubacteriales bacterium]
MKVILKQDVKNLGKSEDLLTVSDGYARNYLIPRGLAVQADAANLNIIKSRKNAEKTRRDKDLENAGKLARDMREMILNISAKAGENGKLFGSITGMDIVESLKKTYGIEIDKKKIDLSEPIKVLGKTVVNIKLYSGVVGKVTVNIVKEQ